MINRAIKAVRQLWGAEDSRPLLSIVVIAYNMQREVSRTVQTLARAYQEGSEPVDYEVVVVDNGSAEPLDLSGVGDIGVPLRVFWLRPEEASASPARAINFGASQARGEYVAVMIDGARMLSPGVVRGTRDALALAAQPVVAVLGLHLGPGHQRQTVEQGYSKTVEDQLLASVEWPRHGYSLFLIAAWGGSCQGGWMTLASESNCIVVSRRRFDELGGYDERFVMPGGGLVNLDFYKRAVEQADSTLIYLAGEGCFHQLHGGVTTGERRRGHSFEELNEEYLALRGEDYDYPRKQPLLYGQLRLAHVAAISSAVSNLFEKNEQMKTVQERCAPFMDSAVATNFKNCLGDR